ncbi:hypothetical protein NBRC116586_32640 [Pseudooceanicola nitratireducens]|uniref:heme-dependent oxidative N-demethylase family protein n=1 Tax=Pseudooceanicola nitratireducens TaxID=517719 RepID=UPI0031050BDC
MAGMLRLAGGMTIILQDKIPYDITSERLPGVAPMPEADWILRDDAFAAQMALRDQLLNERRDEVLALLPEAVSAAEELLTMVLDRLVQDPAYQIDKDQVTRPDGVTVAVNRSDPMGTLGRLVQQDFCLMMKPEGAGEHLLTGAVLCFPAGWMLSQKIGHPLIRIHVPVPAYDDMLARRVQRLFDGVQVGRPLWRFNALRYVDPSLFQPRSEGVPKYGTPEEQRYIRSERQSILRLPDTGAVVFGIHTFVVKLPEDARQ